jgi:hypothetical protein
MSPSCVYSPTLYFEKTEIHAFFMFNKLLQYVKLSYIFFNRPIYISNYRYRKNQCITPIMAINQISNESQIQFSLRTFQTRTYNFINISMCVLVVYISILHKNYLQSSMRITFFFYNRDLYKSILRSLEFSEGRRRKDHCLS